MHLFYRKLGQGEPLFILHGLFGSSDNWQSLAKKFAEHFEVYTIDQRNHGLSFHSNEWNYEAMSNDILELMDELNIQKINLIGHSMGGKAAMHFGLQHPQRVAKLVVADIAPKYYPIHHRELLDALVQLDLSKFSSRKEAEIELAQKISNQGELQFILKNLYWKDSSTNQLAWRFNLSVINSSIEIVGEEQHATDSPPLFPCLFVRGEKSNYISDLDFENCKKSFVNAQLKTINGAAHWVQAEQPQLFFEAVAKFLQV
jgi:esterase